jgi:raffinose/stachyose/melibiose transport system permease protein
MVPLIEYIYIKVDEIMNNSTVRVKLSVIWAYLAPGVLWYSFLVVVPLFILIKTSLYDWRSVTDNLFVGLRNYTVMFHDRIFWKALTNNFAIVFYCLIGQVGIGFIVSLLVNSKYVIYARLHRIAIFLPVVLSTVVVGFMWLMVYNRDFGILNILLKSLGLEKFIQLWLDNSKIVILSLSIPLIWQFIGFSMIIFLSGLQGISPDVLQMAEIDGATSFEKVRYITLPLLRSTFNVVIMLCVAGNMKIFDHIYVMTGGGPGSASMVMALYSFKVSFTSVRYGYGCAISVATLVVSLLIVFIFRKLVGGEKNEY